MKNGEVELTWMILLVYHICFIELGVWEKVCMCIMLLDFCLVFIVYVVYMFFFFTIIII